MSIHLGNNPSGEFDDLVAAPCYPNIPGSQYVDPQVPVPDLSDRTGGEAGVELAHPDGSGGEPDRG